MQGSEVSIDVGLPLFSVFFVWIVTITMPEPFYKIALHLLPDVPKPGLKFALQQKIFAHSSSSDLEMKRIY